MIGFAWPRLVLEQDQLSTEERLNRLVIYLEQANAEKAQQIAQYRAALEQLRERCANQRKELRRLAAKDRLLSRKNAP